MFSEKLAESYFNINDHENEMSYIQHQAKNNSIEIRKTPLKLDLEKLYDINSNIINDKNEIAKNNDSYIIIISLIFATIILSILVNFNIDNKHNRVKFISVQETINRNKEIIESKDKIIDNISKKLNDLTPNESFEEAYNHFCESIIYTKIKSSLEGITILTKNVQDYSKLQLSNKELISLTPISEG
jgi:hypothetical protein